MTTNGPGQHDSARQEADGGHQADGGRDWRPCPQGELGQLVGRLRSRRRNVQVRRLTQVSLAAGGVFAVAVAWFALSPNAPGPVAPNPIIQAQPVASISCGEVKKRTMDFVAGKVDDETKARIEKHLGKCGSCAKYVHEHRPTAGLNRATAVLTHPDR